MPPHSRGEKLEFGIGEKEKSSTRKGGVSSGIVIFARGGVEKGCKGCIHIYMYVDRGKGKRSEHRRMKSKKKRWKGAHTSAHSLINAAFLSFRFLPDIPRLEPCSPSILRFSSIHPNLALASPLIHMQSRMRTSSQARMPRTAHLVFWLRSEPARQISSSRDFYLILPPIRCSKHFSPPPRHTDPISSALESTPLDRRQLASSEIRLRHVTP